jgi:hypothetical protein
MSSYCLTLMAIAYSRVSALPNLQAEGGAGVVWVSWGLDKGKEAHVDFHPWTGPEAGDGGMTMMPAKAITYFFAFFSTFDFTKHVLSPLNGGIIPRTSPHGAEPPGKRAYRRSLYPLRGADLARRLAVGRGV